MSAVRSDELCFAPASVLRAWVAAKAVSPVELLDAVFTRIEELDSHLHAFVTVDWDHARDRARDAESAVMRGDVLGPLHGVPVSIKDLEPTAGLRTTYGAKWLAEHVPTEDGIVADRLGRAGGITIGKTNTPALGHKDMCDNLLMPATRNPWKASCTSGGSSGGAAAAVASGMGPLAHGTDGAGSIRIPSALCGVLGFKPSFGRVPSWPNADLFRARVHSGTITRTVSDAALMLSVMAGPDSRDPLSIDSGVTDYTAALSGSVAGFHLGWSETFGGLPVDSEVRQIARAGARRFEELGCTVDCIDPPWDDPYEWHATLYRAEFCFLLQEQMETTPELLDASLKEVVEAGRRVSHRAYMSALSARSAFYSLAHEFMGGYDALISPTMPCAAWPYDEMIGEIEGIKIPIVPGGRWSFLTPFNLTGWPAATLPCGWTSEGLPVGLQIITPWHQDARCLRLARAFEEIQPWASKMPTVSGFHAEG